MHHLQLVPQHLKPSKNSGVGNQPQDLKIVLMVHVLTKLTESVKRIIQMSVLFERKGALGMITRSWGEGLSII